MMGVVVVVGHIVAGRIEAGRIEADLAEEAKPDNPLGRHILEHNLDFHLACYLLR
jgi:hypothetical protein